jgi:hypothetical protein
MKVFSFLLLISPLCLYGLFWLYALKRGWRSIRILSASTMICFTMFSIILWLGTKEIWILKMSLGFALFLGLSILSWPIIAKELVEKIDFKW